MADNVRTTASWHENEGATARVKQLLEESGALVESRVSAICHDFAAKADKKRGVHVRSDSLTYGLDSDSSPLRQIDQHVEFYKEFAINEQGGVVLRLQLPIEVKHRKELQLVGIRYPEHSYRPRMPISGFLNGTDIFREIALDDPFPSIPLLHPVLLEIQGGTTPQRVFGENLIHNAGSALYDYIHFDLTGETGDSSDLPYGAHVIESMGLMDQFSDFLEEKHFAWWSVLRDWMRDNFTEEVILKFNEMLGNSRLFQGIELYCPIICMDIPIWMYDGKVFSPCDSLLTRIRVNRWPGSLRQTLAGYTAEAPILIVSLSGLSNILEESKRWFHKTEGVLSRADTRVKGRWFIESAFYHLALRKGFAEEPQSWVRSDLDILSDI
jgi:hypothetical protein